MSRLNKYQKISTNKRGLEQNNFTTARRKHIYIDSREDVRRRGRAQTLAKGSFMVHFQTPMKDVRKISIAQLTVPTSFNNMVNRTFSFTFSFKMNGIDQTYSKSCIIKEYNISNNAAVLSGLGKLIRLQINEKLLEIYNEAGASHANAVHLLDADDILVYMDSLYRLSFQARLGSLQPIFANNAHYPSRLVIDFSDSGSPTSLASILGYDEKGLDPIVIEQDEQLSMGTMGGLAPYSADFDGFNYLFIRTPNVTTDAEFMKTDVDAAHKNNILARIPLGATNSVTTFDYTWFPAHMVEINNLEYLQIEFYFYDGSQPNFQSENISMILLVD